MREIEIKAKVADKQALLTALQSKGVELTEPVTQHDRVYGLPGVDGGEDQQAPWLRIREEQRGDRPVTYFTLKRSVSNQLDSIEHEVTVDNPEALEGIIHELGFVPYSDLTKVRQKAHLAADIEICVDTVAPLGDFIEAEKLSTDDVIYEAVEAELWQLLSPFGIARDQAVTDGYDVLMNKHLGKEH